ncbi:hypothetical protein CHS0354_016886 [Potamilus streckersoni]|uniref:RRM domain-containing protein n=1 Tax=Potamilus streckersoni TaxID=2493646 RepID=A0AAE0VS97_9BIVA|nr:hypothetical protein CHS0354_016886 [Potamilus streckersoni]
MMSKEENKTNLIVNYLPQTLTEEEFRSIFLSIGPIKNSKIVRDKVTGNSFGFGFVEYESETDAQRAIQTLDGLPLQTKRLKVAIAKPGSENIKGCNIYVRNLPKHYTEKELNEMFGKYGKIVNSRVMIDLQTKESKTVGFVLYDTKEEADNAIAELNNKVPPSGTLPLLLKYADDSKKFRQPGQIQQQVQQQPSPPQQQQPFSQGYASFGGPRFPSPGGPMRTPAGNRFRFNPIGGPTNNPGLLNYNQNSFVTNNLGINAQGLKQENGGSSNVIFCYNIGNDTTERELWTLFKPYGTVLKCNALWDAQKNQCKGYGFVTMATWQEAAHAIQELNGYYFKNRPLSLSFKT